MNLEEAYRYQNYLVRLMDSVRTQLMLDSNTVSIVKQHNRQAVNPEAMNFEETVTADAIYPVKFLTDMLDNLITARRSLCESITAAKQSMQDEKGERFDIDAAIETAKFMRSAVDPLEFMLRTKPGVSTTEGSAYKFNADGDQVSYYYDVEVTKSLRFDPLEIKKLRKSLLSKADALSGMIARMQIETEVDYQPPYDITDSLEDIYETVKTEYVEY